MGTYHFPKGTAKKDWDFENVLYSTYTKEWNPEFPGIIYSTRLTIARKIVHGHQIPCFLKKNASALFPPSIFFLSTFLLLIAILLGELLGI
jgi:hypothetical protein